MSRESERATIKVVIVEKQLLTRLGLRSLLSGCADMEVLGDVEDGKQALALLEEIEPDVVLIEVNLHGIETARQIRTRCPRISIIMLASQEKEVDVLAAFAAGANGYCIKDTREDRLVQAIRIVRSGDVWLDALIAHKVMQFISSEGASTGIHEHNGDNPEPRIEKVGQYESAASKRKVTSDKANQRLGVPLTDRELQVLNLLVDGLSNQQIAERLFISLGTSKAHVRSILYKLSVNDRTQAAVSAMRSGLV